MKQPPPLLPALLSGAVTLAVLVLMTARPPWAERAWAHLIGPWDPRPELSVWEIVQAPERLPDHAQALCDWLTRETYRRGDGQPLLPRVRDAACAKARTMQADRAPAGPPR